MLLYNWNLIYLRFRYWSHQHLLGEGRMQLSQTNKVFQPASRSGRPCWWIWCSQVESSSQHGMFHGEMATTSRSFHSSESAGQRPSFLQSAVFPHHDAWGVLLHEHTQQQLLQPTSHRQDHGYPGRLAICVSAVEFIYFYRVLSCGVIAFKLIQA